jgi:hypothetical protein
MGHLELASFGLLMGQEFGQDGRDPVTSEARIRYVCYSGVGAAMVRV